jgi:hypothetical protein
MPFINDIKVATAGGADQTLYTCPAGAEAAVPTLYFNARTGAADLTLKIYRQASGSTVEILEAYPVADDTPYNFPKPIMLQPGDYISFNAATNDIVGIVGVYQSGGTGTAAGFNPRGAYSGAATYNRLDTTVEEGTSYACITDGTSGELPSTSANFVVLAAKGDRGDDALGWTGGSYDAGTGTVTFTSDDGLGFSTDDLRGAAGADGTGFTGGSYNVSTGVVTFTSDDGLGFSTGDLRGAAGADAPGWTAGLMVLSKSGQDIPGWLECDGSVYDTALYPQLTTIFSEFGLVDVINLGSDGQLILPAAVGSDVYYYWDFDGSGAPSDTATLDNLKTRFNGGGNFGASEPQITLNGVDIVLPGIGVAEVTGGPITKGGAYTGLAALWDAHTDAFGLGGVPGWPLSTFCSSSPFDATGAWRLSFSTSPSLAGRTTGTTTGDQNSHVAVRVPNPPRLRNYVLPDSATDLGAPAGYSYYVKY